MKKVFALLMVLVLGCALCVPALAAGQTDFTKAQVAAKRGEVPAELLEAFDSVVAQLPETGVALSADVAAVKAIKADVENALNNTAKVGDVDKVLTQAIDRLNAAVSGVQVSVDKLSVDPMSGKVTVSGTVAVNGTTVSASASATAQKVKETSGSGSDSSSNTTSNTAAAAAGVIKATGFDASAVVMVVLAIAGVLGVATVKARKLD